jgi:hypothetical protein
MATAPMFRAGKPSVAAGRCPSTSTPALTWGN